MENEGKTNYKDSGVGDILRSQSVTANVESLIYEIRGRQVMLDSDLARLYQCVNGTKTINQAIKRNIERFPVDFYFRLTVNEYENLKSQFGTSSLNNYGGVRKMPYVFTEQGVAMLATVIKTDIAAKVSIEIMRAFVKMKHYIDFNKTLLPNKVLLLEAKVDDNTKRINELFDKFDPKVIAKDYIFFEGELYDAHSLLLDILGSAEKEVAIIDNYVGKELLDILKGVNKKIMVVSRNINKVLREKYEKQYKNIVFVENGSFHDRFIIIDKRKLYVCGASFKDLGNKCFAIHEFSDKEYLGRILKSVTLHCS